MKEIRTRIAPSPTGMMHLGTARTAIYCWAVARHLGGKFLLRIEDTDQKRSTDEATQVILDSMKWLNLDYDEGPIYQMDRLDRYREIVDQMLADGRAYKCYATPEELDAMREEQRAKGIKPGTTPFTARSPFPIRNWMTSSSCATAFPPTTSPWWWMTGI